MKIIYDPDRWFERPSVETTIVESPDEEAAEVIELINDSELRQLRDDLDKNQIEKTYVTRDIGRTRSEWPALVARSEINEAPRIVEEYQDIVGVILRANAELWFEDVQRLEEYVGEPTRVPRKDLIEALNLIVSTRTGTNYFPSDKMVSEYPALVADCLGIEKSQNIRQQVIHRLLEDSEFKNALEAPDQAEDNYREWLAELNWTDGDTLNDGGVQALEYVESTQEGKIEWSARALLESAKENAAHLLETKLEKTVLSLGTTEEISELNKSLQNVLATTASSEAYDAAQEAADDQRLLNIDDDLSVDESDILRYIEQSKPDELNQSVLMQLEQIPLALYESPPSFVEPVVSALDSEKVIASLDRAIAEDAAQIEKTIDTLENIIQVLKPLVEGKAETLQNDIDAARDMLKSLNPPTPTSPEDCVTLYDEQLNREASLSTQFAKSEPELADNILEECEDYIRDNYRNWANSDPGDRPVAMVPDVPSRIENLLDEHDHILLIVSDGFGLRQWLEATHNNDQIQAWERAGVISNTLMTTIFPSETGAGHYSLFTGQFPMGHGKDDIESSLQLESGHLFDKAKNAGAFTQALSYLPPQPGFSGVLGEAADEFHHLEGLRAEDAALKKETIAHVASAVANHDKSVSLLQHNQIDQLHEGMDHVADSLIPGVADDLVTFIRQLSHRLGDDILPILTADHGMLRTRNSRKSLTHGEAKNALDRMNERYTDLGQRVVGLKSKSGGQNYGNRTTNQYFEILSEQQMRQFKSLTKQKCDGRTLRYRRRYYSHNEELTATHGGFTFDEMFIPFLKFDTTKLSNSN
ncbi:alkaline phosphatase family protein [Halovenus halobia]|uniref:alkaline phosphatase family protein n=1 Tax=Halovenus halobia TaxID=3396622 RepID=UPI003F55F97D